MLQCPFERFEKEIFDIEKPAGGRCHAQNDGNVIITFFRGSSDDSFARTLVHETTHGFLFRYRSPKWIPSWANEGLAQVMEFELIPHAGLKQAADATARADLQRKNAFDKFFESEQIAFDQYPISRALTEFMIRENKKGYVDFINGIKDGLSIEDSLTNRFKSSKERILAVYGQWLGIKKPVVTE